LDTANPRSETANPHPPNCIALLPLIAHLVRARAFAFPVTLLCSIISPVMILPFLFVLIRAMWITLVLAINYQLKAINSSIYTGEVDSRNSAWRSKFLSCNDLTLLSSG
jgi:hypothetical protein